MALVIEDDEKSAELLRLQLEGAGFRIARGASAELAPELANQECPALITLDILLPGMNVLAATQVFKADDATRAIPIVALMALAMAGDRHKIGSAGCEATWPNPSITRICWQWLTG